MQNHTYHNEAKLPFILLHPQHLSSLAANYDLFIQPLLPFPFTEWQLALVITMMSMLDGGRSPAAFLWSSKIPDVIKMMAKMWILPADNL